jgi:acetyl-CoA synthetase
MVTEQWARSSHADHDAETDIAWRPDEAQQQSNRMYRFLTAQGLSSYGELLDWAAENPGRYWDAAVRDMGIEWRTPYEDVVDLSAGPAWATWFPNAGFNYVDNALDRHASGERRNQLALIAEADDGAVRKFTYRELEVETSKLANALKELGVQKGDRVGIFLPMVPEAVIATLACSKIGAVFTPMFSGYGQDAVATRLRDCEASLLITADGFFRRGKLVPMKETADAAMAEAPSVTRCLVLRRAENEVAWNEERDVWWDEIVPRQPRTCPTEPTDANDPYMIIYTSGTTGRPKGAVHVHAGFPIKAAHDLAYCFDLHPNDVLFWLTDLGWMMGPWLIEGGLIIGATICIYEGTPDYPEPDRLWRMVEDHGITILGVAPTAIRALMPKGTEWVGKHDLSSLRILGSTGETWNPGPWQWYFEEVGGGRCPIINYSGGTETGGGIVSSIAIEPIRACSFSGPVPGMIADVVDDAGEPVRNAVGELVMRAPWVGMTRGFWRDPDRYLDTYWSRFPDVWIHGDWAEIDEDGFWFIRGRSDDTLKVAGKRIGPAEVESAAVAHPAVQEAAAVGLPHEVKGECVAVFTILRPDYAASPELAEEIRQSIGHQLGSALRPERVCFVKELPKTRNAKIMRRVIRAAYLGQAPGDVTALENPGAVAEIQAAGERAAREG